MQHDWETRQIYIVFVESRKEICHFENLGVDKRTVNCTLRLHSDVCGLDSSKSEHGPVATLVIRNGLLGST